MDLSQVLLSPVVTEKSTLAQSGRKYTFLVNLNANKIQVKQAIEAAYGVKVKSVNVMPVLAKTRLVGRGREIRKRHQGRKAIVTLAAKESIDFNKVKTS